MGGGGLVGGRIGVEIANVVLKDAASVRSSEQSDTGGSGIGRREGMLAGDREFKKGGQNNQCR